MTEAACTHPKEKLESSLKIWFIGLVTDWRYWVLAVGSSVAQGMISGTTDWGGWANGLYVLPAFYLAMMLSRYRKCGACGGRVRFKLTEPPPPIPPKA